jgi:hypothetical protein
MDKEKGEAVSATERYGVFKTPKKRRKVFINDELHHLIHINLPADVVTTYNYVQDKILKYPYKAMKKNMKKAYSIGEVAKIINRHPDRIRSAIRDGELPDAQRAGPSGKKYWKDDDILNIQDYFANVHFGRPRNDGAITPKRNSVTKEEVDAKLGRRQVLYVQNDDGEFIPVWRTVEF